MVNSNDILSSNDSEINEYIDWYHELMGVRPQDSFQFPTWFDRQSNRLAQLDASPTRPLTNEEREHLELFFVVGTSVQVCEMPVPREEFQIGFALATPAANVLYGYNLKLAAQMALRMGMLPVRCRNPDLLIRRFGRGHAPLLLFAAVGRPRCPGQVRQASIGLAGSSRWFTDFSTSDQQILLVHEVGDFEPRIHPTEHIEYMLAYPKVGTEEGEA